MTQHGGGGTISFWKDIVFIHVLLALGECGSLAQAQASLLLSECTLHYSTRRPGRSSWLCHHSCDLGKVNFPLRASVPLYKPWNLDSMSSNILWFYMFLLLNYEELIPFFYFKVIATPNPHGICSGLYFCVCCQAFCAVFGVTGTISFSFQLLSSFCHSTKEIFASVVKGDLWLSSFGSRFKCSFENLLLLWVCPSYGVRWYPWILSYFAACSTGREDVRSLRIEDPGRCLEGERFL